MIRIGKSWRFLRHVEFVHCRIHEAAQIVLVWMGLAEQQTERAISQARGLDNSMRGFKHKTFRFQNILEQMQPQKPFYEISKDFF